MAVDRRALWIGATLIVAVVAVMAVGSMTDAPAVRPTGGGAAARGAAAKSASQALPATADVRLEALTRARGEPADGGRNPFRFQPKPPPPPPPSARVPALSTETPLPVVPAGPPPPPPIALKFIGLVEKADGTRIAVLSDGRRTHSGVEGQEIDGRYRILKIGNESIDLAYIDGRGRQTIRLTGQ